MLLWTISFKNHKMHLLMKKIKRFTVYRPKFRSQPSIRNWTEFSCENAEMNLKSGQSVKLNGGRLPLVGQAMTSSHWLLNSHVLLRIHNVLQVTVRFRGGGEIAIYRSWMHANINLPQVIYGFLVNYLWHFYLTMLLIRAYATYTPL